MPFCVAGSPSLLLRRLPANTPGVADVKTMKMVKELVPVATAFAGSASTPFPTPLES